MSIHGSMKTVSMKHHCNRLQIIRYESDWIVMELQFSRLQS